MTTILMDPHKMLSSAGSLRDAAVQTRSSARALGALSSPPPGVPAAIAGRVTSATNSAIGALQAQAGLIESLADDLLRRAQSAAIADAVGQITGMTAKVGGLAAGVGQAVMRYQSRWNEAHRLRRQGWSPNKIRDEVDRRMAKKYGIVAVSASRRRQLEKNGPRLTGPDGRRLPSSMREIRNKSFMAQFGGVDRGTLKDVGGYLKRSPTGPLAAIATLAGHASTVTNPNLTGGQKVERIADDTASAAVGAAPIAAGAALGGPPGALIGTGVAGLVAVGDIASGGKVSEVTRPVGEGGVDIATGVFKGAFNLGRAGGEAVGEAIKDAPSPILVGPAIPIAKLVAKW